MLISVDRFTLDTVDSPLTVTERRNLLARFGIFGVRLGAALVRGGARTSSQLSERMIAQSGLIDVQRFVADQFRSRGSALKARSVLVGLELLLEDRPARESGRIRGGIERITANSHDLRELALLAALRLSEPVVSGADDAAAERLVGGAGTAALTRLGLDDDADADAIHARVDDVLGHWRTLAESPLADRATSDVCRVVVRSVEGIASELAVGGRSDRPTSADVVLAGRPA